MLCCYKYHLLWDLISDNVFTFSCISTCGNRFTHFTKEIKSVSTKALLSQLYMLMWFAGFQVLIELSRQSPKRK